MKTLLISLFCVCASASVFAQTDTTNSMNNSTYNRDSTTSDTMPQNNQQGIRSDSSMDNSMQNKNMQSNNMQNNNMNSTTDTSGIMNGNTHDSSAVPPTTTSSTYSGNNAATNNNYNGTNQMGSMQGTTVINAALPVLETYVPENIVEQVKQKYPNDQIYDITAVRSPEDTTSQNGNSWNGTNTSSNNSAMDQDHDRDDSATTQNNVMSSTAQNKDAMTPTSQDQNSSINNNGNANSNLNDMSGNSKAPEKFDYVVRVLQGGQLQTETLMSDGTALVQKNSTNSQLTSQ